MYGVHLDHMRFSHVHFGQAPEERVKQGTLPVKNACYVRIEIVGVAVAAAS